MCRIKLANKQLLDEIQTLDRKATQRKSALERATKELDDDRKDIMSFMEKNTETRRLKE
jgi:hypothetical protein